MKSKEAKRFFAFLVAGGLAALVNFGSRIFINQFTSYVVAIVLAYLLGMITAFVLYKYFVFNASIHSTSKEFLYFTLINILAIIQTLAISLLLYHWVLPWMNIDFYNKSLSHAAGVIFPVFTSFIGHKYLSFKSVSDE